MEKIKYRIDKRDIKSIKNRLKNCDKELEDILNRFKTFDRFDGVEDSWKHSYDKASACSVMESVRKALNTLICVVPIFGNRMVLSNVSHDLPLLFLNYDEDVVRGSNKEMIYDAVAQLFGADSSRLISADFWCDGDKKRAYFLRCYLTLTGLKNNASSDEEAFNTCMEKMKKVMDPYADGVPFLSKLLNIKDKVKKKKRDKEDYKQAAINFIENLKAGNSLNNGDWSKLYACFLSNDDFKYELLFLLFGVPGFRSPAKQLTDQEIMLCFEHYLASYIDPVDYSVKEENRVLFDALFSNYIRFYLSHVNNIFDDISLTRNPGEGISLKMGYDPNEYMRCANKICFLMTSFLNEQHKFIDDNRDILSGIDKQEPVYVPGSDTSTYTEIHGGEPVTPSQKEKTGVYAERLRALEDVFGSDAFAAVIARMINDKEETSGLDFLGIKNIPTDKEALKKLVTKIHNSLISIYTRAHEIASDSKNGLFSVYKDGQYLNLQSLPEIDTAVELCNEFDSDEDRESLIGEIIDNLRELRGELDKLTPVDDQEHNIIYYTVPVSSTGAKDEKNDAEDVCIMGDIKDLARAGQGQAIQSCLLTMHEAASQGNIDDIISGGTPVKGTNGCPILVRNKKVIFTYAEYNVDGKHTKKIIILGAGNGESVFARAQEIANSAEFKAFYNRVCNDPDYSQPLDYAGKVLKSCSKGKAKTIK